jgi:hypothetical protein
MAEGLSVAANTLPAVKIAFSVVNGFRKYLENFASLTQNYSLVEALALQLGNSSVWRMERRVLEAREPQLAMDFKRATQDKSQMITIAVCLTVAS